MKNIELEYRTEVNGETLGEIKKALEKNLVSTDRRLSIMFWGEINAKKVDLRARIDSLGKAEVVLKSGSFHSEDRVELSTPITKEQIIPLAQMFFTLGLKSKVTERENSRYELPHEVSVALVSAKHIHYVEIEKMTDDSSKKKDSEELLKILGGYKLSPINESHFNDLCDRLSTQVDWAFTSSREEINRIEKMLAAY